MATVASTSANQSATSGARVPVPRWVMPVWAGFVVAALLGLTVVPLVVWGVAAPIAAAGLLTTTARRTAGVSWLHLRADGWDLVVLAGLYVAVVALFRGGIAGFAADRVALPFLAFGGGLLLGVAGPVIYTTWIRHRPLRTLGLGRHALRPTLTLALIFGVVQFTIMFWGYSLPAPADWVPLLVLSLTVGLFEAVFFRGFVQGRLEASFGTTVGVAGAAGLYALYHVGYGMSVDEMTFLFGLGVVYAIAYCLVDNILVLWPLLTPIGAFFNNLEAGDIALPWASIAGFADVLAVMAVVIWIAFRHQRRAAESPPTASSRG